MERILIVDDDRNQCRTLEDLLEINGYAATTAETGEEALGAARGVLPAVCLVDLMLPDMGGLDLVPALREASPGAACIVLTGHASQDSAIRALEVGAYGYQRKPLDIDQLLLTIQRAIEQRNAVAALSASEERYASLIRSSPDGIVAVDANGRVEIWNPAASALFGYTSDEMTGRSIHEVLVPQDMRPTADRGFAEFQRSGEGPMIGRTIEMMALHRDGREIPIELSIACEALDGGWRATAAVRDVSERRRVMAALREREERYRQLIDNIDDGLVIDDLDGRLVFANDRFFAMLGLEIEQTVDLRLEDWVAPEWRASARDLHERRIRGERAPRGFEFEAVRADGTRILLDASVTPVRQDGKITGTQAVLRDVTERRRTAEQRDQLAAIVEQSSEAVVMTDAGGVVQYANIAFEHVMGASPEDTVGKHAADLLGGVVSPRTRRVIEAQLGRTKHWAGRLDVARADGARRDLDATISPLTGNPGAVIGYVATVRDVTQVVSLEAQLRQSQKMEAVGELAGGVAHDFNNLLLAIGGYAELLGESLGAADPRRHRVDEILKAQQRAATLTRQLLAFSRKQILDPRNLDVSQVVSGIQGMLGRLIGENVELVTELAVGGTTARADEGQIEQVIVNLVLNARDAMPEGGRITVRTAGVGISGTRSGLGLRPGRYVRLSVSDTGTGMSQEVATQVFDPFFTTKTRERGTGLGLSTVHGIIKQSGGEIRLDTREGEGARFDVFLPYTAAAPEPSVESDTASTPSLASGGGELLLVLEDDPAVRLLISEILGDAGYRVLAAVEGEDAIEVFSERKTEIDLVLSDVILPGRSGPEVVAELHALRPDLRALFMSGYTDDTVRPHLEGLSRDALLTKPFTPEKLLQAVRVALDRCAGEAGR